MKTPFNFKLSGWISNLLFICVLPLAFFFASSVRAQELANPWCDRYTYSGGDLITWQSGTLGKDGVFSPTTGTTLGLWLYKLDAATATAINGKYLITKSFWIQFGQYYAGYHVGTTEYSVNDGICYELFAGAGGSSSNGGGGTTVIVTNPIRPINISTRSTVQPGSSITVGFVLSGDGQKNVLIRAVGPGLVPLGVPTVVAEPSLKVYNSSSAVVGSNAGWCSDPTKVSSLSSTFASVGAFALPANSKDSALVVSLGAGSYTAVAAAPASGVSGDMIAEVYILDK